MKSIIVLLVLLIGFSISSFAQIPYYDALRIKSLKVVNNIGKDKPLILPNNDSLFRILKYYLKDTLNKKNSDIIEEFQGNPFITFNSIIPLIKNEGPDNPRVPSGEGLLSTPVAGINVTNFADGVAKFLVGRFKEELSAAFFDKFKKELNNPDYIELQVLFPETRKTLNTIDQDIYMYSNYLNTLRESFINDMTNEFVNLEKLLNTDKYKNYLKANPEFGSIVKTSLYVINSLSSGKHPGNVLANFNTENIELKNKSIELDIRSSIHIMQLFSESFRSKSNTNYWVTSDSIYDKLIKDTIAFKIYLGLIYQKAKLTIEKYTFSNNVSLKSILDTVAFYYNNSSINEYKYFIESFIDKAQEVNEYITDLRDKKKSEIDYNDYYKLFGASLDLLDQTCKFIDLPYVDLGADELEIKNKIGSILYITKTSGEIYIDVRTKNYSSAIVNTISFIDAILPDNKENDKLHKSLLKYGSFIAAVAQAQNSDDVKNAIESAALPAGSYSIKQHTQASLFVNGYMGYAWDFNHGIYMTGIYAPLGISGNLRICNGKAGAIGIFASFIDVGGLAAYRLTNSTDTLKQTVKLQNIISPSLQLMYEIPTTPISICIGWRMTPTLFYSGNSTFETIRPKNVFNVSLLVDIPIFTIKTSKN
jgi:hypothetical protein